MIVSTSVVLLPLIIVSTLASPKSLLPISVVIFPLTLIFVSHVLTSTLVYELVGPMITKFALTQAGEIQRQQ